MTTIPDSLRLLFETPLETDGDSYVLPIPDDLVENGTLSKGETYRVALIAAERSAADATATATDVKSTSDSPTKAKSASDSKSATREASANTTESTSTGKSENTGSRKTDDTEQSSSAEQSGETSTSSDTDQSSNRQRRDSGNDGKQTPPVEEGEVRKVAIETLGDQGDGIARVERGFIVIVPGTQPGDDVEVKITDVKDTVAFAKPVGEATVR